MRRHCILLAFVCALSYASRYSPAQGAMPDLLDKVRASVVRIEVVSSSTFLGATPIPNELKACFGYSRVCIVGTGIIVDESGDVLTAAHVALAVQNVMGVLSSNGVSANIEIGLSTPNFDNGGVEFSSGDFGIHADVKAVDTSHDVAVLHPQQNPFTLAASAPGILIVGPPKRKLPAYSAQVAKFDTDRPRDAEQIFACGFPLGQNALVTTSGAVASAWSSEIPLIARQNPQPTPLDIYQVDLRINPGNSGGPVFRVSDLGVIGIVVELGPGPGALSNVIPSKYLTEFLTQQGISWEVVPPARMKSPTVRKP